MTTFLLIRHGAHLLGHGIIAGRTDVQLSPQGLQQAQQIVQRVAHLPIRAIYSSPVLRAQMTAQPLAERLALPIQIRPALSEIDFGTWTGCRIDQLRAQEHWSAWNHFRSGARAPGGESMLEVQARMAGEMLALREQHPDQTIALFSHGDPIKSAIAYFLGISLDQFLRIEISLASISVLALADQGPWVLCVNSLDRVVTPESAT